ncbi:MAG TPA: glycoside hydrolase family 15 protein [Pirellulales bacterium]|jgi:GH15 family glucan-1,4-alpha-glucosidase|nr:glycoside hydrolase family 15 protein [Pirellulales bacterium]
MALPLEDYGLIGDCQTAALVGRDGSVDWLCFPNFDSAACFAALLGTPENGRWLLAPTGKVRETRRRYRGDTLVLETYYETDQGAVTVVDCMPPRSQEPDLVRVVTGQRGKVPMRMELVIRFDYGWVVPWVQRIEGGIQAVAGPDTLVLHTPAPLKGKDLTTTSEFSVSAGETVPFVLMWHPSHEAAPAKVDAHEAIAFSEDWWRDWSSRCTHQGEWREAVIRSLITLKALTFATTGGIVAAPTTSLPEELGGVRNWDYRFCWLRDATFTLYSLLVTGYSEEAMAFRDWLLRAVAGDPAGLQIMYSLGGARRLTELELGWLPGYENSHPVRIGNAASAQFQLDVYGEVLDMIHLSRRQKLNSNHFVWRFELALLRFLEHAWRDPDDGIWEVRGPRRHFTHSKVMAWVAFDRAIKAVESGGQKGPLERWRKCRAAIHAEVCSRGFNQKLGSFVQYFDSDLLDASLLMLPLVGFLPAKDKRIEGTVNAIQKHLTRDGFVDRYHTESHVDGLPPGEATFLPCSFWMVDNLALLGRLDEARELFERLLAIRTDLGLLSEGYHPRLKRLLGNFPQAFSHVGLVNSARNLGAGEGPAEHRQKA